MALKYSPQGTDRYTVLRDGIHRIGVLQKIGFRWLAIAPPNRTLGSFASMSEAGKKLIDEEGKMNQDEIKAAIAEQEEYIKRWKSCAEAFLE